MQTSTFTKRTRTRIQKVVGFLLFRIISQNTDIFCLSLILLIVLQKAHSFSNTSFFLLQNCLYFFLPHSKKVVLSYQSIKIFCQSHPQNKVETSTSILKHLSLQLSVRVTAAGRPPTMACPRWRSWRSTPPPRTSSTGKKNDPQHSNLATFLNFG